MNSSVDHGWKPGSSIKSIPASLLVGGGFKEKTLISLRQGYDGSGIWGDLSSGDNQ
jgi:hypothetical protein